MSKEFSVLIVDDEEPMRNLLTLCLNDKYKCVTAGNAAEASSMMSKSYFNMLLTDLEMPGGSGFELCKQVKDSGRDTLVVVVSGMTHIKYAIEAIKHGAFDYIAKPFDMDTIRTVIDRAAHHQMLLEAKRNYEESLEETIRVKNQELRELNETMNNTLEELYSNYRETLRALAAALETRRVEANGHSDRVVAYCLRLGKELNLTNNEMLALEQGALLHDVGMLQMPDTLMRNTGALSNEEREIIHQHIDHGLRVVSKIDFLKGARPVVSQHHEKYDGSGYPIGLQGDEIHLHARIFALADAFDAITSDRSYRTAQSFSQARLEIINQTGKHFDPKVVQAFLSIPEAEWREISEASASPGYLETFIDKRGIRSFIVSLKKRTGNSGALSFKALFEPNYSDTLN